MRELEPQRAVATNASDCGKLPFDEVGGLRHGGELGRAEGVHTNRILRQVAGGDDHLLRSIGRTVHVRVQLPTIDVSDHPLLGDASLLASVRKERGAVNRRACTACQRLLPDLAFPSKGRQGRARTCSVCVNDQRRLRAPLPDQVPDVEQIRINNAAALWFGPVRPMPRHAV
ncbi:hypothetical protein ACIPR8_19735 [Stenotrophomonas sp. LARHCG68]